jgi:protein O-mannosyl-transferase
MTQNSGASKPLALLLCVATVAMSGFAAYSNTMSVPFLFDDIGRIVDETAIRTVWPPTVAMQNSNRPFAHYTFALNYAWHGYDVWGYHAVNLGIHVFSALFLFGFARLTLRRCAPKYSEHADLIAFSIALVWVVHPLNTQAVTYIVQRLESLMGLAYLATLYCFAKSQDTRRTWVWLLCSVGTCAFGMGCKEVMVSAPIIVLWYDRAFIAKSWRDLIDCRKYYYVLLACTWGVLAWSMLHYQSDYANGTLWKVEGLSSWTYLLSQSAVIVHYLSLAFWPSAQCVYPAWPVSQSIQEVLPQFAFILGLILLTMWAVRYRPNWSFLGGCFFLILAPTSSIIPIKDLAFEHRMYLPLAALVSLAFVGVFEVVCRLGASTALSGRIQLAVALLAAAALGTTAFERNKVYVSEVSVWKDTLTKAPRNVSVWVGLGGILAKEKKYEEAKEHFVRALEIAPSDSNANASYAGLLIELGEYELAGKHLSTALKNNARNLDAITNMGHLQSRLGNFDAAAKCFEAAIQNAPNDEELQSCLIASLIRGGNLSDAERFSHANLELRPDSAKANVDYASVLVSMAENAKAIEYCEKAIALDESLSTAHATLATIEPDAEKAMSHIKKAIELEPLSSDYNRTLGDMLMQSNPKDSIEKFEIALKAEPNSVELLLKVGAAWDAIGQPEKGIPYLERVTKLMPDWVEARQSLEMLRRASSKP